MKRRWIRRALIALGIVGLLVLFAPALAGTGLVRARVERWVGARTGLDVSIGSISAGWWSGLEARDVRATVPEGEFAGSEVMVLDRAVFEPGLAGLLARPDTLQLDVRGLVVTVEERAGARTNLDRVLERLLPAKERAPGKPAPAEPAEAPPREKPAEMGPTLHVRLTDSRLELRRLVYRPPTEPINPFERDVPIRDAGEGVEVYRLDAARVELQGRGERVSVRADVTAAHADEHASLHADVRIDGGTATGDLSVEGFDLALLEPLVQKRLRGRVTVRASGRYEPGRSRGTVLLDVDGLATGEFAEEWIKGRVAFAEGADSFALETIELSSASGRFAARGALDLPRDEPSRPSGTLEGTFPLAPIYQMTARRQPPATAQVRFELETDLSPTGGRVDGRVSLDHFTIEECPDEVTLRFAMRGERATRRLHVESFAVRSDFARADLSGTIDRPPAFAADLTGSASGDLARLQRIAAHFSAAVEKQEVAGRASVRIRTLRADRAGNVEMATETQFEGLRLPGRAPLDLYATFEGSFQDRFDRLVVRDATVRDLHLAGNFYGLRAHAGMPGGEARLSGTVTLSPRLLDLLALRDIDDARGDVYFQFDARSDGTNVTLEGGATIDGLSFQIDRFIHDEPEFEAKVALSFDGERVTGRCGVDAASVQAALEDLHFDVASRRLAAQATVELPDASVLRPFLGDGEWAWSGRQSARLSLQGDRNALSIEGRIDAPSLRLRYGEHGLDGEPAALSGRARYAGGRWDFAGSRLTLPGRSFEADAEHLAFGNGEPSVAIRVRAPLEKFPRYAPDLAGALDAHIGRGADATYDVTATIEDLRRGGRPVGRVEATAGGIEFGAPVRIPRVQLRTKGGSARGRLEIGDEFRLQLEARGDDVRPILALLPRCEGSGRFDVAGSLVRQKDGRVVAQGKGSVEALGLGADRCEGLSFETDLRFRRVAQALDDLRGRATFKAQTVRIGPVSWHDAEIVATDGRGSLRDDGGGPGHRFRVEARAARIGVPDRELSGVRIEGNAVLHHLRFDADDALEADGTLHFDRIPAAVLEWRDGTASVSVKDRVLLVRDLRATANGGELKGRARADLRKPVVPWSVELELERARLTADFTDPLSYVVPILRLKGKERKASGYVGGKLELSAEGTQWDHIRRTLKGSGLLRLREAEITGSLLMPLLSLRVGRLLLNKPYRIPEGTVNWKVEKGVVKTDPLKLNGLPFNISLGGSVTLDGELDYVIHPGVLLVPLRVTGTWGKVRVLPAPAEALPNWPWKK